MSTRPTTLVESDQLAQAAAHILALEDFVPKSRRWAFARPSKAQRDYEKAVLEVTTRRRETREKGAERKAKQAKTEADGAFERAKAAAQAVHDEKLAEARKPYDEVEARARAERDAAIAAANAAYQAAVEKANSVFQVEAATLSQHRDGLVSEAKLLYDQACAVIDAARKADLAQIAKDLRTISIEGPMRIVEDREVWTPESRKKALIGIVDMAGEESSDAEYADLCLRNVVDYVFQDRYLKPEAQSHRLMDARLLEAFVDLAQRNPQRRPLTVKYMYTLVEQNPGHSSPSFIKNLTQLYVSASGDADTVYSDNAVENEAIFDTMRAQIADILKLTPRRSLIPGAPASNTVSSAPREPHPDANPFDDEATGVMSKPESLRDRPSAEPPQRAADAEITADVNIGDLLPAEHEDDSAGATPDEAAGTASTKAPKSKSVPNRPPPVRRSGIRTPEGSST
jgi:hypothetical protein